MRVWPGIKKVQRFCRGGFVNLNLGIRGGKREVFCHFADIDNKYMRHEQRILMVEGSVPVGENYHRQLSWNPINAHAIGSHLQRIPYPAT